MLLKNVETLLVFMEAAGGKKKLPKSVARPVKSIRLSDKFSCDYNCKVLGTLLSTTTAAMKLLCGIHLLFSLIGAHCVLLCP